MRKFFVSGFLVFTFLRGAFAISIQEPTKSTAASSWELFSGNTVTGGTILYGDDLTGFTKKSYKDTFTHGTYNDEGALVALIAREIYENGAKFCITQIQSANKEAHKWQWLDYYAPTNSNCFVMCKSGFGGDKCDQGAQNSCDSANYTTKLSGYKNNLITSGNDSGKVTNSVQVLSYKNQRNQTNANMPGAEHIVLGVIGVLAHGVKVAPIKINGERDKTTATSSGMTSWIKGISIVGPSVNLCALGYKYVGDQCIPEDICNTENSLNNLCTGNNRSDYIANEHVFKQKGNCYVIRCKTGYAFENTSSKSCKECSGIRQGPDSDGVCRACERGTIYSKTTESCDTAKGISKEEMQKCWQKTDLQEYKTCLKI